MARMVKRELCPEVVSPVNKQRRISGHADVKRG